MVNFEVISLRGNFSIESFNSHFRVVIFQYDLITQIFMVLRAGSGLDPGKLIDDDLM